MRSSHLECSLNKACTETFLLNLQCGNPTGTQIEAGSYEFTTLNCIVGVVHYNDVKNQLLHLPDIIEGGFEGNYCERQACTWIPELNCLRTAAR